MIKEDDVKLLCEQLCRSTGCQGSYQKISEKEYVLQFLTMKNQMGMMFPVQQNFTVFENTHNELCWLEGLIETPAPKDCGNLEVTKTIKTPFKTEEITDA